MSDFNVPYTCLTYYIALAICMIFIVMADLPLASRSSAIQMHVQKPPKVHITYYLSAHCSGLLAHI